MCEELKSPTATRAHTPESSRPSTPVASEAPPSIHKTQTDSILSKKKRHLPHFNLRSTIFHHPHSSENVVGVFESQRYLDLEARLTHPESEKLTQNALLLLLESCKPLAEACTDGLQFLSDWYASVNESRFSTLAGRKKRRKYEESVAASETAAKDLNVALQKFRTDER